MFRYLVNYPFRRSTPLCFRSNFFARFFQLTHFNKKPTSINFLQIRRSNPWTRHCTTQVSPPNCGVSTMRRIDPVEGFSIQVTSLPADFLTGLRGYGVSLVV